MRTASLTPCNGAATRQQRWRRRLQLLLDRRSLPLDQLFKPGDEIRPSGLFELQGLS